MARAAKAVKAAKSAATETVSAAETAEAAKKIMIVEDERRIARFLQMELEHEGFETESEENGRRAYERIVQEQYDLVLLDICMPGLDGMEAARRLRAESADIGIIFLTTSEEHLMEGYRVFADGYFLKPLGTDEEAFQASLRHVFARRDQSAHVLSVEYNGRDFLLAKKSNSCSDSRLLCPRHFLQHRLQQAGRHCRCRTDCRQLASQYVCQPGSLCDCQPRRCVSRLQVGERSQCVNRGRRCDVRRRTIQFASFCASFASFPVISKRCACNRVWSIKSVQRNRICCTLFAC